MNQVNPKALLHSKWTKVNINNREKHFVVTKVTFDEQQKVVECLIEAVLTKNEYAINWRDLKLIDKWRIGWQ